MNRYLILLLLAAVTLGFYGCGQSYNGRQRQSMRERMELARQDSAAFKIATTPTMDCLPLFIGVEDSLFQKRGVDVRLCARTSRLDGDTLIAGDYVAGVVSDLVRTERLKKQGVTLRYVAATNSYWQFVSNRLSRVKKLSQMSDKMVAMTRHSATDYLSDLAINGVKTKSDVYRVQINDVNLRVKMLLNNEMDAAMLTEPQATMARVFKNPVLMDSRDKGGRLGVIAFSERALAKKDRQRQLKLFIKVYDAICDSININGVSRYGRIIKKYMFVDDRVVKALPQLRYQHAVPPREKDVRRARGYLR